MKKLFFTLLASIVFISIYGQAPQEINYQGVARNSTGTLLSNQNIGIKLDLHQGSAGGTVVFSETHNKTTNSFGLFTLGIGSVNVSGFTAINWANGPYFLEVSMDPAGGTSYSSVGTQQFMSVPYALYAQTAGNASTTPTITINSPNTVTSSSGSYTINVPASITYSAGTGIDITGGVISNTAAATTPTITGTGATTVTASGNTFTINTPSPNVYSAGTGIDITGGVISNTSTAVTPTITSTGIAVVTPTTGNIFNVDVPVPVLSYTAGTNVLSLSQGTTVTTATLNGTGSNTISMVGSGLATVTPTTGSTFTVSVPNPTFTTNGPTSITGTYPNYTVNSVASPTTSLVSGNLNLTLLPSGNTYTLDVKSYSLTANSNTLTLSNGASITTATVPAQTLPILSYTSSAGSSILQSGPVTNTVSIPNYTLSNTSNTITLNNGTANSTAIIPVPTLTLVGSTLQSGPTTNTVSLSGIGGIYGGSGSIQTGSTTVTVGTNTLTFLSGNTANKPIANFFGGGITGTSMTLGHVGANSANFKFIGSATTTPVDYGYVSGSTNGISISGGTSINGLYATNSAEVGVGSYTTGIGKFIITHTATQANPTMHLRETTGGLNRIKFSNNTVANKFFETAAQTNAVDANGAYSINYFDGTTYKPVLLVTGEKKVNINNLNTVLGSLHVMENSTTAGNGIISEGFAQAAQINLVRNNQPALAARTAVVSGDEIGKINFAGYDGAAFGDGAKIYAKAAENVTSSNKGTELVFAAVPTGTNTTKDVFKINGANKLEVITSLLIPTNSGAGKVLTSDAAGNASWQVSSAPASAWTSTLGNTYLVNSGDKVGIGTNTPSESLDVNGNINIPVSTSSVGVIKMAGTRFISAPGTDNLFVGKLSGNIATSGFNNVAFGNNTLQNLSSGANNVGIGYQVMQVLGSGSQNIAIGTNALSSINIGNNNTALGFQAGNVITSGSNNLFLGYNANANLATLTNASAIGYLARVDASNSMVLGSINGINGATASAKVGIGTTTPQSALEVATDGSLDKGLRVSNANSTTNGPSIYLDGQNQDWSITGSNAGNGSGANKFVIRDYSNAVDRFVIDNTGNVGIGTTAPINKFHVNGSVAITDGTQGLGKVLVSDASGNASWMPIMKITYGSASCQSIASVSTTPVKFNTNLGSVVKTYSDTHLEVILQTDLNVFDLVGANSVTYEIKVNGISSNGNTGKAVYFVDNANALNIINNKGVTITAEFDGLTAGSYNVELWAYCLSGNALNVYIDPGCFGASSVIIKEFK